MPRRMGHSSSTTTMWMDAMTIYLKITFLRSPSRSFVLLGEWIIGEQHIAQTQIGIIEVRMQHFLVDPFLYLVGLNQTRIGEQCMNLPAADGFVEARILTEQLPVLQFFLGIELQLIFC